MIQKILFSIILLASDKPSLQEKLQYLIKLIVTFAPIAFLLEQFDVWFVDNEVFFSYVIVTLLVNIFVGGWYHKKNGSFEWAMFFRKNIEMWVILILVYPVLEMVSNLAGHNIVGDGFKVVIQIATLLYPASKVFKNAYILSNKKFPPSFIMDRIYNFEKSGNLKDLAGEENTKKEPLFTEEDPEI
tara:strand:+ start:7816 stop:8373 length:558 start_codon:yes stop_codon:yes gene_type:complete